MSTDNSNLKLPGTSTVGHPQAQPFWLPGGDEGILVIHGYGGSAGDYHEVAESFQRAGYSVLVIRVAGHGGSLKDLAKTHWPDWQRSVDEAVAWLSARCLRVILFGISFGGILALDYAARSPKQVAAVITLNTALRYRGATWRRILLRLLRLKTRYYTKTHLTLADRSRMEQIGSLPGWPIDGLFETQDVTADLKARLASIVSPVFILATSNDPYIDSSSAQQLGGLLQAPYQAEELAATTHRPLRDPQLRAKIVAKIKDFLTTHLR